AVERERVVRPSTSLYGTSRGTGDYPDGLDATAAPRTDPAYFTIAIAGDAAVGHSTGELRVGERAFTVELDVRNVTLPPPPIAAGAYYDRKELGGTVDEPNEAERACIALFRERGILLSPDMPISAWPMRKSLVAGARFIPALVPTDPAAVGDAVRAW